MKKTIVTQERLLELVTYNENIGVFTWNESRGRISKGQVVGGVCKTSGYKYTTVDKVRYYLQQLVYIYKGLPLPNRIAFLNEDKTDIRAVNLIDQNDLVKPIIDHLFLQEHFQYDSSTGIMTVKKVIRKGQKEVGEEVGTVNGDGYLVHKLNGKNYLVHRMAFTMLNGREPETIDHINQIKTDNRLVNLREADQTTQQRNRPIQSNNTSGVVGVSVTRTGSWNAHIGVDGERINLGTFIKFSEAVDARKNAEVLHGFHENHGRII